MGQGLKKFCDCLSLWQKIEVDLVFGKEFNLLWDLYFVIWQIVIIVPK